MIKKWNGTLFGTLWLTVILSFLHGAGGGLLFLSAYKYSEILENSGLVVAVLTILYALPVLAWFRTKYWAALAFLLLLSPLGSLLFFFIGSLLFPVAEGDLGAGILWFITTGINLLSVVLGTLLGGLTNLMLHSRRMLNS
ncbi:hypothetical protein P4H65_20030 [Paenibacillus chitinolyticus]|uniref:hypothetical protein n=1 Tax=Paenibacillus chitinolyticus TaxID=79263 RepID=UPI002DBFF6C2|nr:hypothetical protein [Paenibacillus chitinolyticus]MEC0248089.1 hypothetical protein [Paenibacillus chitinolyticus]